MFKKLVFLMTALILGFMTNTASAVSLKIDPSFSTVSKGDPLHVSIDISDFAANQSLGAFDLDLNYDNTILSLGNVSFGNQLSWGLGSYQETTLGSGEVGLLEISYESIADLNNNQAPSFSLANLTFNTIGLGNDIPLVLSVNDLSDAAGYSIIPSSVANGSVTVTAPSIPIPPVPPVPVPAQVPLASNFVSIFLLVAGFIGVAGAQRKLFAKV